MLGVAGMMILIDFEVEQSNFLMLDELLLAHPLAGNKRPVVKRMIPKMCVTLFIHLVSVSTCLNIYLRA